MKVCIFGGTFDPPHVGHLVIGETIKGSENFDKIIFIPSFIPPHKDESYISSIEERLEMLHLCLDKDENFELSDVEVKRGNVSYTIETIRDLKTRYNLDKNHIYFLMGSDSLLEFHQWKNHNEILTECQVLVALRPRFHPDRISPEILSKIRFANVPQIEISSSQIRERIHSGLTVRYMVPDLVWEYIKEKGMYK